VAATGGTARTTVAEMVGDAEANGRAYDRSSA